MPKYELKSELMLFDVTNLVVGTIIGVGIYVASAFGASLLGPFSLILWVVAGIMATVIALCFAQRSIAFPEAILRRTYNQEEKFLAHFLRHIKRLYRRIAGKQPTWKRTE